MGYAVVSVTNGGRGAVGGCEYRGCGGAHGGNGGDGFGVNRNSRVGVDGSNRVHGCARVADGC